MSHSQHSECHMAPDPGMDCPNPNCSGFLNLYLFNATNRPAFLQCSNKHNSIPSLRCDTATIFSRKPGTCPTCNMPIALQDIITVRWDREWVHIACAFKATQPPEVFARCLRCKTNIVTASDASPSSNAGLSGYVHLRCMKGGAAGSPASVTHDGEDGSGSSVVGRYAASYGCSSSSSSAISRAVTNSSTDTASPASGKGKKRKLQKGCDVEDAEEE